MMYYKPKVTFVLPGRNRSGGVRVTVEMANRLRARGFDTRIAYRQPKAATMSNLKGKFASIWMGLVGYSNRDWVNDFVGRAESFVQLSQLAFNKNEVVIAVGVYTVRDVYELNQEIIKVRFNHGFSEGIDELTKFAWGPLPMTTITVSGTLYPRLEALSGKKVAAVIPNGINTEEYYIENIPRNGIGMMFSSHPNKAPKDQIRLISEISVHWPNIPIYSFGTERRPQILSQTNYYRYPSIPKVREIYNQSLIWLVPSQRGRVTRPCVRGDGLWLCRNQFR